MMLHYPDCDWQGDHGCTCADRRFWASATDEERQQIVANRRSVPEWAGGWTVSTVTHKIRVRRFESDWPVRARLSNHNGHVWATYCRHCGKVAFSDTHPEAIERADQCISRHAEDESESDARARYMERMGRNRSREERLADLRDNAVNAPTIERGDGK